MDPASESKEHINVVVSDVGHREDLPLPRRQTPFTAKDTKSLYRLGKGALITAVISLALHPFSVWVGYLIGKALKAPRPTIEYLMPVFDVNPGRVNNSVLNRLRTNSELNGVLRANLERLTAGKSSTCDGWITSGEWDSACQDDVSRAVAGMQTYLDTESDTLKRDIDKLAAFRASSPPLLELSPNPELQEIATLLQVGRLDSQSALSRLRQLQSSTQRSLKDLAALTDEVQRLSNAEGERTGDMSLKVGILNSGDSDGVVYAGGEMRMDSRTFPLQIEDRKYVVVKSHSFEEVEFRVESGDDLRAFESLRSDIRDSKKMPYVVRLKMSPETSLQKSETLDK